MALKNDALAICRALEVIEPVNTITRGWPKSFESLPTLAVSEAGNTPAEFRDDDVYLDELVYDVRIFSNSSAQKDAIAPSVDEIMTRELGYQRILVYDDDGADVRMKVMRYRRYG